MPPLSITFTRAGVPPVSITFTRGGVSPVSLLCTHIRCGGARRRFPTSADTPLTVRFTAIVSKLTSSFFYQALPHLIYSLFRVDKMFGLQSERNGVSDNANRHRQLAGGALYGYCIKIYKFFFLSSFSAPNI